MALGMAMDDTCMAHTHLSMHTHQYSMLARSVPDDLRGGEAAEDVMRLRHHNRRLAPRGLRSVVSPHMVPARLLQVINSVLSGTRGSGCVPWASLSPWECRAAQSHRTTSEEATWGEASDRAVLAGSGRGCRIPVECGLAIAASKMRGESFGSAAMPDGGAMIKHGRFCGSPPGCGTSLTISQPKPGWRTKAWRRTDVTTQNSRVENDDRDRWTRS